ncbi:MAG: mechanosensitive ion channel domain-containing protein [Candidatus Hydrothermarchaeales archaeon]
MVISTLLAKMTAVAEAVLFRIYEKVVEFIPNLIVAIIILLVGIRLAKWTVRYSGPVIARTIRRPAMIDLTLRSIKYAVIATALMIALSTIGLDLTPLFTAVIASSVIIGIIIAPMVSSYLGGLFILVDRPFEVGDRIEITGLKVAGFVKEIGFRVTRILTTDGNLVVIPNTEIAKKDLINYSAEELRTRRELPVMISYESDLAKAMQIMIKAAKEVDGVIKRGEISMISGVEKVLAPQVLIQGFGDSGIELVLRVWYKNPYYLKKKNSDVYERIFYGFQKEGINIPYPHRDLILKDYIFKKTDNTLEK